MAFRKFVIIIFIAICPILSCSKGASEFHVAIVEVPKHINPADANRAYALYIIKQLFEPLFKYTSVNLSASNILDSWESYNNHSDYKFCIKDNVSFSNGRLLNTKILKDNIEYFETKNYLKKRITDITENGRCLFVKFEKPYPQLLFDLMSYRMAIFDPKTLDSNVIVGVSPYRVMEITPSMIHLQSNKKLRFKNVFFHKWIYDEGKPLKEYDDINAVSERYLPKDIDKYLDAYDTKLLKTVAILINHNNPQLRNYLFNCVDYTKVRNIMYPHKKSFVEIGGILPLGLPGAINGPIEQKCPTTPLGKRVELSFPFVFADATEELQSFLNESLSRLNIDVEVGAIGENELLELLFSGDKKYDATIVAVGVPSPASIFFFEHFIPGESNFTNIENIELRNILERYYETTDENEAARLMEMANRSLVNNHQILPLFQMNKRLYFSKKVGHITSDQLFIGIPNISEL